MNASKYNKSEILRSAWVIFRTSTVSFSQALKSAWTKAKTPSFTMAEAIEVINKEIAVCYSFMSGNKIELTVRGKKTDKVFVRNGEVSFIGKAIKCNTNT